MQPSPLLWFGAEHDIQSNLRDRLIANFDAEHKLGTRRRRAISLDFYPCNEPEGTLPRLVYLAKYVVARF